MMQIIIIGAGQLGSRHLQALNLVELALSIHLVDPSTASIEKAVEIFHSSGNKHPLQTYSDIGQIPLAPVDVAIVATNSLIRRKVIEELVAHTSVKYLILEKFLFPELDDYDAVQLLLKNKGIKTWVNCPRRMFDTYKEIKNEMRETSVISISGSAWGLGCNGIHMLDLIAFLTGEHEMHLDPALIDHEIIESKRAGYIEFTGKITGHTASRRHSFTIASYAENTTPFVIYIQTGEKNYIISEGNKKLLFIHGATAAIEEKEVTIAYQSQLTNRVVEQLINLGNCELTEYSESARLHEQFLKMLLDVMSIKTGTVVQKCPIT